MRIAVYNQKGGVGKTSLGCALAKVFADGIVTNEDNTKFSPAFGDETIVGIPENEPFPIYEDDINALYECGGFFDERLADLFFAVDLIVVPFMDYNKPPNEGNDWHITYNETIRPIVEKLKKPVAFVHNLAAATNKKEQQALYKDVIDSIPNCSYHSIGRSQVLNNIIDTGIGPHEAYENAGPAQKAQIKRSIIKLCDELIERAKES